MHKRILGLSLLFIFTAITLQAQLTLSSYSRFGLGSIFEPNSTRNFAMGGLGLLVYYFLVKDKGDNEEL